MKGLLNLSDTYGEINFYFENGEIIFILKRSNYLRHCNDFSTIATHFFNSTQKGFLVINQSALTNTTRGFQRWTFIEGAFPVPYKCRITPARLVVVFPSILNEPPPGRDKHIDRPSTIWYMKLSSNPGMRWRTYSETQTEIETLMWFEFVVCYSYVGFDVRVNFQTLARLGTDQVVIYPLRKWHFHVLRMEKIVPPYVPTKGGKRREVWAVEGT